MTPLHHEPWQVGSGRPTDYDSRLADALEAAFTAGHTELAALIAHLNQAEVRAPEGSAWTAESFKSEIARLAA